MEIVFYILIFIIGTLFGSFSTLAIYRLPLKKDIVKERSFCPNCNHKLGVFDLIPILSYIFLGGKCRYCKEKISKKYLIIEIMSGILAVILFKSLEVSFINVNISVLLDFIYLMIYGTTMIIIAVIDKEKKIIYRPVIIFGTLICLVYMLYLCVVGSYSNANIYRYIIYTVSILVLYILNNVKYHNYIIDLVIFIEYIQLFVNTKNVLITILVSALITIVKIVYEKTKPVDKSNILMEEESEVTELSIAFYIAISNFIVMFAEAFMNIIV